MIKLGANTFNDIKVLSADGLYDWPKIKEEGTDWIGDDFKEASTRVVDYQYRSRIIKLECLVAKDSWSDLQTWISEFSWFLPVDPLLLLVIPDYSKRGYMVRLKNTTIFEPRISDVNNRTIATFTLIFEEPQPMNIQFSFYSDINVSSPPGATLSIANLSKSASLDSTKQKFITVDTMSMCEEVNLEQEDCSLPLNYFLHAGVPFPVIITGEIDNIEDVNIDVGGVGGENIINLESANLFLRNGSIL
jgi:hypothetical protein